MVARLAKRVSSPGVPSHHTSGSIAIASVPHEFYGLKVGLPVK